MTWKPDWTANIAVFPLDERRRLQLDVFGYRKDGESHVRIELRRWYLFEEPDGQRWWRRSPDGVTFPPELCDVLADALLHANAAAQAADTSNPKDQS